MLELLVAPISALLEKVVPDLDERKRMAHDIATMAEKQAHAQIMAQMEVNKQEAMHRSFWVAGWRPAVGWICALSMGFNFVICPVFELDPLDLEVMMPVLLGMLGLGGMRSYEKKNGVTK